MYLHTTRGRIDHFDPLSFVTNFLANWSKISGSKAGLEKWKKVWQRGTHQLCSFQHLRSFGRLLNRILCILCMVCHARKDSNMRFCWGVVSCIVCRLVGRVLKWKSVEIHLCARWWKFPMCPSSFANNLFKRLPLRQSQNMLVGMKPKKRHVVQPCCAHPSLNQDLYTRVA